MRKYSTEISEKIHRHFFTARAVMFVCADDKYV